MASDFVGTLTEDIALLSTQDDAPQSSAEAVEPASPGDSSEQSTGDQEYGTQTERPGAERANEQQPDEKPQGEQPEQAESSKPQADGENLDAQFPGGREQASEVIAKAAELASMDSALKTGDVGDMGSVVMNAFTQAGPERFQDATMMALNILEDRAPAQFQALVNSYIGERLKADGTWDALETLYAQAKENPQAVPGLLNEFATYLTGFGLGPANPAAEESYRRDYSSAANEIIQEHVERDVLRLVPPGFNAAPRELQNKFLQDMHGQIEKWARVDKKLQGDISKLFTNGLNRRVGIQACNLLIVKARSVLSGAIGQVMRKPEYAALRNAPQNLTKESAGNFSEREIMDWNKPVLRTGVQRGKQRVSRDEARKMPYARLLDSSVEVSQ